MKMRRALALAVVAIALIAGHGVLLYYVTSHARRVYHHLSDTAGINASLLRSMRPGGVLAVIDFPPPFFLSRGETGVSAKSVVDEVTRGGFELVRLIDDWPGRGPLGSYCVLFRRPR